MVEGRSKAEMANPVSVNVLATEREIQIKLNGITHCRVDRRELVGLQSWIVNRGRVTPVYAIELCMRCSVSVTLEYDNRTIWENVLAGLDTTAFFNEWKNQDP